MFLGNGIALFGSHGSPRVVSLIRMQVPRVEKNERIYFLLAVKKNSQRSGTSNYLVTSFLISHVSLSHLFSFLAYRCFTCPRYFRCRNLGQARKSLKCIIVPQTSGWPFLSGHFVFAFLSLPCNSSLVYPFDW